MTLEQQYQDEIDELKEELRRAEALIETERRKAFEAGFWQLHQFYTTPSAFEEAREKAYRAYTEAARDTKEEIP